MNDGAPERARPVAGTANLADVLSSDERRAVERLLHGPRPWQATVVAAAAGTLLVPILSLVYAGLFRGSPLAVEMRAVFLQNAAVGLLALGTGLFFLAAFTAARREMREALLLREMPGPDGVLGELLALRRREPWASLVVAAVLAGSVSLSVFCADRMDLWGRHRLLGPYRVFYLLFVQGVFLALAFQVLLLVARSYDLLLHRLAPFLAPGPNRGRRRSRTDARDAVSLMPRGRPYDQ